MKAIQHRWSGTEGWSGNPPDGALAPQLVLVFGSRQALEGAGQLGRLREAYPDAVVFGCSTAGEIDTTGGVHDDSIVVTAVRFDHTKILARNVRPKSMGECYDAGRELAASLPTEGLRHAFVLSDGIHVNGSELARGLSDGLPAGVLATGGLSADGDRFERTSVVWDAQLADDTIGIIGFYGTKLRIGCGSLGGWDMFGPERVVTRSRDNVLYELDGRSALALYKDYLGDKAEGLPATGLLFPLAIRSSWEGQPIVRTILGTDDAAGTMTFAGDVPEGSIAQLMHASFDRLVDGAAGAARASSLTDGEADLAILISCVGRKLALKQRTEEEVDSVREVLGPSPVMTGFYSYGELSPQTPSVTCELHNQTMTITTFSE
ncbi:MAG: FIST C-terminal domain-containing protein [Candidatus Eisenbacteria bacterium]|uniref:FIST C-terminal domain-containing protein n=1 Tax=Eiseniibacteriota bacterium TaxID=2212470 RepID=A0A956LY26_UNCEI|nr:FIST C-terminal domain-containing protein [Candidatus Eisenbacteria bacterium]